MPEQSLSPVARHLDQEAAAMTTRLQRIRTFAMHETMVPAATLQPQSQRDIDQALLHGRGVLRRRIGEYRRWLRSEGRTASPADQQKRFVNIRMQFNDVISQFDLFAEVITQRSERDNGVWLAGLDALARDALAVPGLVGRAPAVACYLARGPGAAIRRAKTPLPGGLGNPVAIIRVPRERMVGHGIGSSLIHEVGHQGAAILGLVESLRRVIDARAADAKERQPAWALLGSWISEIVADLWSVARLGVGAPLGLMSVVSLPSYFVFRSNLDDPHPTPFVRVLISAAFGRALYPDPQLDRLVAIWKAMYPTASLPVAQREILRLIEQTIPEFVGAVLEHRSAKIGRRSLGQALVDPARTPAELRRLLVQWETQPDLLHRVAPSIAMAAISQARADQRLSPQAEGEAVSTLLQKWALDATYSPPRHIRQTDAQRPSNPAPSPLRAAS